MNTPDHTPDLTPHRLIDHAGLLALARPRPDAAAKLAAAPFPSDHLGDQALHGAILGSPHPHARILAIDTRAARALPGVHAVLTAADIPGTPCYGLRHVDRPVLCADKVRCIGDPVAVVAADTAEQAHAAVAAIRVDYALLAVVDDPLHALEAQAEAVHAGGNLLHHLHHAHGDLAAAVAACEHVVEDEYHSPRQMHAYLETEGGIVEHDDDGRLVVRFGCQNPERDRQVIAGILNLPPDRLRVIGTPVGGSYGGKDELTIQPLAALLALKTGRAVRLHLNRGESTDLGVKRHPMRMRLRSGCDADGRLRFIKADILADTGAYATHGPEVLDAAIEHVVGPYAYDAVSLRGRLAYTNNGIAGAFRGFGAVQTQFALERQIDRLAALAGLDPLCFRQRNLAAPDAPGPLGQHVLPFDGPHRALEVLRTHALWAAPHRHADGRYLYGTGLALVHRSDGFGKGGPNAARLVLALAADGKLELRAGFTEMGQNLIGAATRMMADHLHCAEDDVRIVLGDSALTPDSGPTAASRTTSIIHRALRDHGPRWRAALVDAARVDAELPSAARTAAGGLVSEAGDPVLDYPSLAQQCAATRPTLVIDLPAEETPSDIPAAHLVFGASAALAQVRVDSWSGQVKVERLVLANALGPVISAEGLLGQMEGGAVMGQGMATIEDLPSPGGRYAARNLDGYFIPTLADAPEIEVLAIENLMADDPAGPRGAGEISVNVAVPAVANAIAHATGLAVTRLPVTPDTVLDHLERQA